MMQLGLVPPEGITFPREASASCSWLGSHPTSALAWRASSSDLLNLQLPAPVGSIPSSSWDLIHIVPAGSLCCDNPPGWVPFPQTWEFEFPTPSSPSHELLPALLRSRGCSGPRGRCSSPTGPPGHDRSPSELAELSGDCSPLP